MATYKLPLDKSSPLRNREVGFNQKSIGSPTNPIGLPPAAELNASEQIRLNMLPIVKIYPCRQHLTGGIHVFTLDKEEGKKDFKKDYYDTIREVLETWVPVNYPLHVGFLAENFPSETFSSEYGQSFLEKMADVVSGGVGELSFMLGSTDIGSAFSQLKNAFVGKGEAGLGGLIGKGVGVVENAATSGLNTLAENIGKQNANLGRSFRSLISAGSRVLAGGRIDLPQVWKNSNYSVSYAITVRLYNPNPASKSATERFIIAPLIALLLLVLPKAPTDEHTGEKVQGVFHYPYLCKVDCPGVFGLPSAFVSSINIIKGGDQGLYGMNKGIGMIDVRIEFGNLYGTLVQGPGDALDFPTLVNYAKTLNGSQQFTFQEIKYTPEISSARVPETPADMSTPPGTRTSSNDLTRKNDIEAQNPQVINDLKTATA